MLPLYKLVLPITALSLGHYIVHQVCYSAVQRQYQANTLQLQDTEHVSAALSIKYIALTKQKWNKLPLSAPLSDFLRPSLKNPQTHQEFWQ